MKRGDTTPRNATIKPYEGAAGGRGSKAGMWKVAQREAAPAAVTLHGLSRPVPARNVVD